MKYSDLLNRVSVLYLESDSDRRDRFDRWTNHVTTKVATTPEELYREFDSSVAVAFLSRSSLDGSESEVRRFVLTRNPSCQLILVTATALDELGQEDRYDATIPQDVSRESFQSTLQKYVKYSIYSMLVEEYYALNAKLVALKRSDPDENEEALRTLADRIETLEVPINNIKSTIDHEDARQLLESVDLHRRYLNDAARNEGPGTTSKYRPDACPNCSVSWGVDHSNEREAGMTRIGANVWRCDKCHYVVRGSDGSNRYIT